MRIQIAISLALVFSLSVECQRPKKPTARPVEFEIGVRTFFDFGPPFDYYSLYIVRASDSGVRLDRYLITPAGDKCVAPAKIDSSAANLAQSIDELLGVRNPCDIPEKNLKHELKRCKRCLVFSGANVTMRVSCGGQTRLIRSDILDRDMFDPAAKTPENTSWTMNLLNALDKAAGPGVMDKPIFPEGNESRVVQTPIVAPNQQNLEALANGAFDGLFAEGHSTVSSLYRETQSSRISPFLVTIKGIKPTVPENAGTPKYPPLARLTKTQGTVTVSFDLLNDGTPNLLTTIVTGHPLLQAAVKDEIAHWKFQEEIPGERAEATFEFSLNCPK